MGLFGSKKKEAKSDNGGEDVILSDGQSHSIAQIVDCLGDSCPRPQLMTKKAVSGAESGQVIQVVVDNPTSMEALPPMCPALDATHLETVSGDKGWQVYIRKN